jgi:hypothetical protein
MRKVIYTAPVSDPIVMADNVSNQKYYAGITNRGIKVFITATIYCGHYRVISVEGLTYGNSDGYKTLKDLITKDDLKTFIQWYEFDTSKEMFAYLAS